PAAVISARTSARREAVRATSRTVAPARPSRRAVAAPIPSEAPVTSTTLPATARRSRASRGPGPVTPAAMRTHRRNTDTTRKPRVAFRSSICRTRRRGDHGVLPAGGRSSAQTPHPAPPAGGRALLRGADGRGGVLLG